MTHTRALGAAIVAPLEQDRPAEPEISVVSQYVAGLEPQAMGVVLEAPAVEQEEYLQSWEVRA